jgi:cardiolipin synthase
MPLQWPMLLTWVRIFLIPLVVGVFFLPHQWVNGDWHNLLAASIFVFAALTDALDGYLARRLNQTSAFGAFLDPVADKLMVSAALVVLVSLGRLGPFAALIIIGREIAVSALREWMASMGAGHSVAVSSLGKLKTMAQMVAIPLLLLHDPVLGIPVATLGTYGIWLAAALTVWSMCYYLLRAWPAIQAQNKAAK